MYIPAYFKETDAAKIRGFLNQNDFGTLTAQVEGRLWSVHLPFLFEGEGERLVLKTHLARGNRIWKSLTPETEVLVQLLGAHHYISPTWYAQINVPTWNYQAVHLYGKPRLIHDPAELRELLGAQINLYEADPNAYSIDSLPDDYFLDHIRGLVGLEIEVTEIQAAFKLSQNRNETDHANIIHELEKINTADSLGVAKAMSEQRPTPKAS